MFDALRHAPALPPAVSVRATYRRGRVTALGEMGSWLWAVWCAGKRREK
jgi:hypothetical protein